MKEIELNLKLRIKLDDNGKAVEVSLITDPEPDIVLESLIDADLQDILDKHVKPVED